MMSNPEFTGGINIAMKVPKAKYEAALAFYRDVLKFNVVEEKIDLPTVSRAAKLQFGTNTLWLDCVDNYSKSELWLELRTPDVEKATSYLEENGVATCDELEKIPGDMHWITDPAGTVLLVCSRSEGS